MGVGQRVPMGDTQLRPTPHAPPPAPCQTSPCWVSESSPRARAHANHLAQPNCPHHLHLGPANCHLGTSHH